MPSFAAIFLLLVILLLVIVYQSLPDEKKRSRFLSIVSGVYLLLLVAAVAVYPERLTAGLHLNLTSIVAGYQLLMVSAWILVSVLLVHWFPKDRSFVLRFVCGVAIAFVLVVCGGNFLFTLWLGV